MGRFELVVLAGAVVGGLAGLLAPVVLDAACVWGGRADRSIQPAGVLCVVALVGLGTVNGAVGAWDGWRSGGRRMWPVAWAPASLLQLPVAMWALDPSDSKSWGPALIAVGIVAPFVWVAGRVGQEVGAAGRPKSSVRADGGAP